MKSNCPRVWCIASAVLLLASRAAAVDEIGIYFDESASSNCLTDNLFAPVSAYLTILEPTAVGGVSGWEGTLGFDPALYVSVAQYYGNCINVGQFPDFVVGLAAPLPATTVVVVARLSVFATAPGGLWFRSSSQPSIPGSTAPIYCGPSGELVPLQPVAGNTIDPLAIIGYSDCSNYVETDSIPGMDPVTNVVIDVDGSQTPNAVRQFSRGSGVDELGFEDGNGATSESYGITDFDIGADGYTYILDAVNERIVILDQDLMWLEVVPVGALYLKISVRDDGIYLEDRTVNLCKVQRCKTGWELVHGIDRAADKSRVPGKTAGSISLRGGRVGPAQFKVQGTYSNFKSAAPAFSWDLDVVRPAFGVAALAPEIVLGAVFLRIDYLDDASATEADVAVIGLDGHGVKSVRLPEPGNCTYRLPISTKAGPEGSIVSVRFVDTYTEVAKWNW